VDAIVRQVAPPAGATCYHCGLPVTDAAAPAHAAPEGVRRFCCVGCEAVSLFIHGAGLDDYYRLRSEKAPRPDAAASSRDTVALYDEPAILARFATRRADGTMEADLIVEGMTCAACAWLVEHAIERVPGVAGAHVNFATRRARVRWREDDARASAIFACVMDCGCKAWPFEAGRLALVEEAERRSMLRRFLVAALGMMQVMMYAAPAYLAGEGEITADVASLMRWAGLLLTVPVIAYSAAPFFRNAWQDLRARRLGVDVPVCLGLAAAFTASVFSTLRGSGAVYFDSVTMFVFFVTGARYLERAGLERAGRSLQRLAALVPSAARRMHAGGEEVVSAAQLRPGDRVLVRAGESVPADGLLASTHATVSEALLSGESAPLERRCGERVLGGSLNCGDAFIVRVTHAGADTVLSTLRRMMELAAAARAPWVEAAQKASGVFVVVILAVSALAALAWLAVDPSRALWVAISVLIVTCPCALSLATPAAMSAATGALARRNVVVTKVRAIEALAGATDFVFDKTGTLTLGRPRLVETVALGHSTSGRALAMAAALGADSPHPLDQAIRDAAHGLHWPVASLARRTAGRGIEALVAGRRCRLGSVEFCRDLNGIEPPAIDTRHAHSIAWLADEQGWIAALHIADALRPGAGEAMESLRALGISLHLLSGDDARVAARAAERLGIANMQGGATPAGKQAYVRGLQARGARVAMVGDGINDAPVLAQADVSVAMGGGADLAQVRADAVLASDSLEDLVRAVRIARKARAVVRENLAWALAYNLAVIPLAVAGQVTPLAAAIAMSASSLLVVANALRIR